MTSGELIKNRRKELGMNAETLAKLIGVSPQTMYRYESGAIEHMGVDKLPKIAEALRTTPAYLLGAEITDDVKKPIGDDTDELNAELREILSKLPADKIQQLVGIAKILAREGEG